MDSLLQTARSSGHLSLRDENLRDMEDPSQLETLKDLISLDFHTNQGTVFPEIMRTLLLGNPRLQSVTIGISVSFTEPYNSVLREWARSRPSNLRKLVLLGYQLDDETCAVLGEEFTEVQDLFVHPPLPAPQILALVASMRTLRRMNIHADRETPRATFELIAGLLREHPVLENIELAPPICDFPCPPGSIGRLAREHGVVGIIGNLSDPELDRNIERCKIDYLRRIPWPYNKVFFLGDTSLPGFVGAPMYKDGDSHVPTLAPADELVAVLAHERPRDMVNPPSRAPPAAYDPALGHVFDPVSNVPLPVPDRNHGKHVRIRSVDLRGVVDPLIPRYASVVLAINMSRATDLDKIPSDCDHFYHLSGNKRMVLMSGKSPDDTASPKGAIRHRALRYYNVLAGHTDSRRNCLAGAVGGVADAELFAKAARKAAAFTHYGDVPYSWAMAATLLLRADADDRAVITAAEWAELLASCKIEARYAADVLDIVSLAAPFQAVTAEGAVMFLRDDERLVEFFIPPTQRARRALRDARLLEDREARKFYEDGCLTPVMAKIIYGDALDALGRRGAAVELPDADTVAALLVAARVIVRHDNELRSPAPPRPSARK